MCLLMGVDLGTTVIKAALFDQDGRLRGLGRVPVEKQRCQDTCELSVETFWAVLSQAIRDALSLAGARPEDVSAAAYASQANSFVLLNGRGECLTPLILWPDLRAESLGDHATDLWRQPDFLNTTGVGVGGRNFCPYKLDWFRCRQPELWNRVEFVQTISDHLVYGLTSKRLGDASTASMTGLWDQGRDTWWHEGLEQLQIPPAAMSRPLRPGSLAGPVTSDGAKLIGLCAGTPLVVAGLDHYMAAVGAGLGSLADIAESTGTVLACIALMNQFRSRPTCCTGPTHTDGVYYQLAFNETGTTNLDWYRENFAPELSIPALIRLAEEVAPGSLGLLAKPVLRGQFLEDAFVNVSASYGHGHYVRAILEANATALDGLIRDLCPEHRPLRILATGGGARSDVWLQIKADLLGMEVVQVDCEEPACQGAAMMAAVALDCVSGLPEASAAFHRVKRRFSPDAQRHAQYMTCLV